MTAIAWTTIKTAIHAWFVAGSGLAAGRVLWGRHINRPAGSDAFITLRMREDGAIGQDWTDYEANPLTVAATAITSVDFATGVFTRAAHGRSTGDGPIRLTSSDTLPAGAELATDYWVIRLTANTFKLAESHLLAIAGIAIVLTDAGLGVHTYTGTAATLAAGAEIASKTRGARRLVLEATCFPPMPADGVVLDASEAHAILSEVKSAAMVPARRGALRVGGVALSNVGTVVPMDGVVGSSRFEARALLTIVLFVKSEITSSETIIETVVYTPVADDNPLETVTVDLTPE